MNELATDFLIDVRPMPPRERHPKIFGSWEGLSSGNALLLVNDHDPIPLYYQFMAEHGGTFRWEYLEQGPDIYRVRITKGDFPEPGFAPARRTKGSCAPKPQTIQFVQPVVLDTRPIFARGEGPLLIIEEALNGLIPGQPLVLIVDFEPVPLYNRLARRGFSHQSSQQEDGAWRVEIRKQ